MYLFTLAAFISLRKSHKQCISSPLTQQQCNVFARNILHPGGIRIWIFSSSGRCDDYWATPPRQKVFGNLLFFRLIFIKYVPLLFFGLILIKSVPLLLFTLRFIKSVPLLNKKAVGFLTFAVGWDQCDQECFGRATKMFQN
jgi:hypothetical protein